jgi:hypothetical protein
MTISPHSTDVCEPGDQIDADAKSAGVVLCPGVGFDLTKMLGKHRARDPALRRAARVALATTETLHEPVPEVTGG